MIDLYTAPTPNGWKASCTLEELEIPYETHPINMMANEQKEPWFLKPLRSFDERSPALGRRVVLVDHRPEPVDQGLLHVNGAGGGTMDDPAQR